MLRTHGDTLVGEGMLDFAVNIWPMSRPAWLTRALSDALTDTRYPDESTARYSVAQLHARAPEEVLLLNGAAEGFWLIAHALRPRRAAVVHPSFTEPEAALRAVGADVVRVMRESETWTFEPGAVPDDVDLVAVGSPNNPTGNVDPPLVLDGPLVVVDGSFADFVPFEPVGDVVVRSLTKVWGLAGIRAGYLLAPAELVERLEANRQPWSVNALACAALAACAGETPEIGALHEAREELAEGLRALGFHVWASRTNFLLLEAPGVVAPLRRRGIAVRPCETFPGLDERHIRVAVRTPSENARLLRALEEIA
jgi:histidinol-phosphate/aromatic aminotransferase/cobyric acid decarboxylase-like protein